VVELRGYRPVVAAQRVTEARQTAKGETHLCLYVRRVFEFRNLAQELQCPGKLSGLQRNCTEGSSDLRVGGRAFEYSLVSLFGCLQFAALVARKCAPTQVVQELMAAVGRRRVRQV